MSVSKGFLKAGPLVRCEDCGLIHRRDRRCLR